MNTIVADFKAWFNRPFRGDMDWLSLFLAIGLVIVMAALWTKILSHLSSRLE